MIGELRLQGGGLSTEVSPRSPGTPNPVPVSPICRQVQEVTFPGACRRILLFFGKNSYFQNEVLVKEYVVSAAGKTARHDCLPAGLPACLPACRPAGLPGSGGWTVEPGSPCSTVSRARCPAGYRASHSTPIQWSQHYEREAYRRQTHDNGLNFFNWFCGHHLAGSGRIAEVGPCDRLGQ